jgi:hypothetical protein
VINGRVYGNNRRACIGDCVRVINRFHIARRNRCVRVSARIFLRADTRRHPRN